jgi:phosphodiesterase/alkaline phosphatase D-like protein
MARLLLGPLLRHVGERDATFWVETDQPCEVEVRAGDRRGTSKTFTVACHHYAIVVVDGLVPATSTPYEVRLDDSPAWPEVGSRFPPSRIRTIDRDRPIRILFGSCREPPSVRPNERQLDPDIFDAFANRMINQPHGEWPDILLLVGDQVYADDTSPKIREYIKAHRDIDKPPKAEVANFEEYTRLYYESWGEPTVRWLLSTLPSSMIFDDHDVRDDWNTSGAWRDDMQKTSWWEERITGALMSYWIYQHLGNLGPAALEKDPVLAKVRSVADAEQELRAFAQAADREADGAKGAMWSYRRDFGPVRVVVIDSRCGRILADNRRSMIADSEFDWIERQVEDGPFEHLVIVTSMPWLLPRALHDIESWNEALCAGSRGRAMARLAEGVRRAVDLEHWAAFRKSFDRLAAWFERVGRGEHGGPPPATITVLSGDVHHTYVSEADYPMPLESRVFQITCSPIHNTIPLPMKLVFRFSWSRTVERVVRFLDRWARVPPMPIGWHHPSGPHFGNTLAQVTFDRRRASVLVEKAVERAAPGQPSDPDIVITASLSLTESARR